MSQEAQFSNFSLRETIRKLLRIVEITIDFESTSNS